MEAFEQLMSYFMSPKCFEQIFVKLDLSNVDCLKMIISKCLSYGIIAGSLLLKVPQILKICSAKSGDGISLTSEILLIVALFGSMSYGYFKKFALSAYGDNYFLFIQSVIIFLLVCFFQKKFASMLLFLAACSGATFLLFANLIPDYVILTLNSLTIVLTVISRLNQALLNYRSSSTGALSAITLILQFLGVVARIFTSIQETGDFNLILNFVIASIVNGLLVFQLFWYWNSPSNPTSGTAKKVKKTQ